jgi:hypothetical protein
VIGYSRNSFEGLHEVRRRRGAWGPPPALLGDATRIENWKELLNQYIVNGIAIHAIHDDYNILNIPVFYQPDEKTISLLNAAAGVLLPGGTIGVRTEFFKSVQDLEKFLAEVSKIYDVREIPSDIESLCKVGPFGLIDDYGNGIHLSYCSMIALIEGGLDKYNELSRHAREAKGLAPRDMSPECFDFINEFAKYLECFASETMEMICPNLLERIGVEKALRESCTQEELIRKFRMANSYRRKKNITDDTSNVVITRSETNNDKFVAIVTNSDEIKRPKLYINKVAEMMNEDLGYYFTPENMQKVANKSPLATVERIRKDLLVQNARDTLATMGGSNDGTRYVFVKKE